MTILHTFLDFSWHDLIESYYFSYGSAFVVAATVIGPTAWKIGNIFDN